MKRIHPTRRERAAIRESWKNPAAPVSLYIAIRYTGRPTRKQRRPNSGKCDRTFEAPHGGRRERFRYCYGQQELRLACRIKRPFPAAFTPKSYTFADVKLTIDGKEIVGMEKGGAITVTATPPTEEQSRDREAPTITINGVEVPATITKDPAK